MDRRLISAPTDMAKAPSIVHKNSINYKLSDRESARVSSFGNRETSRSRSALVPATSGSRSGRRRLLLAGPHLGVGAAAGEQLVVAAVLDHPALLQHQDLVGVDHGREAMRDDQRGAAGEIRRSAAWIRRSVWESSAEVASSNTRIGGSLSTMRAIATRCFSPPESLRPRSPTRVS